MVEVFCSNCKYCGQSWHPNGYSRLYCYKILEIVNTPIDKKPKYIGFDYGIINKDNDCKYYEEKSSLFSKLIKKFL